LLAAKLLARLPFFLDTRIHQTDQIWSLVTFGFGFPLLPSYDVLPLGWFLQIASRIVSNFEAQTMGCLPHLTCFTM
jgi:nitrate reductase beta subunit